jgi:MFS family permease
MSVKRFETQNAGTISVPWKEFLGSGFTASLVLICLSVWLHAADSLIVATMLPSIIQDIGGAAFVAWTVSLYEIGSIVAGVSSALLTMRYGLRSPMAAAALLFGGGCILSALASEMWVVLVGRLVQGFGGGGMVAMAFVAVSVIFPKRYMARAMAVVSTLWGVSAFLGPLIGGFFVEYADWRAGFVFFAAQAVALGVWILLFARIPEKPVEIASGSVPVLRLLVLSVGMLLIAYAGIDIQPLRTTLLIMAGLICLIVFLWLDSRQSKNRLLPSRPINITEPTGAALVMILTLSIATIAITAYGPILVILIHDASPMTAGYLVACSSIGWSVMAVLVSGSPEKHDGKFIALGMVVVTVSIVGFIYSVPHGPIWLIALCATLEGGGFGIAWTFILRRTTAMTSPVETQRISAAIPTIQRLGYALGAAYIGIVANAAGFLDMNSSENMADIAQTIFLSCLPFAAIGLLAMLRLYRQP